MGISVEGLDNVKNALANYANGANEKLARGIAVGCKIVEGEARAECPEDTGALRRSIHGQVDGATGIVGTNKEYAAYVEFGTYKMAAKPYLVPALKGKQGEVIAAIAAEFKR